MAKLPYRILYNQDCTNLFGVTREPLTPAHVDHMVDEVADGGADVMFINPNAQRACFPSKTWQTFWDGYAPGRREFFGPIPDSDVPGRERWVSQMKRLADAGCDYLARALARCRAKGITPGVSIRMNDMHDVPWPGSHLFSRFYIKHPELWLDNGRLSGWSARGLNYEHAAVREHYLTLIRELAGGYDFDVLELDFLRFTSYFPRGDFERHCDIMTDFLRQVREILRKTGRTIALIPRVAATPASAYELGFDVARWAREALIEGLSAGMFFNTAWQVPLDAFRRLLGPDVALFAGTDNTAARPSRLLPPFLPLEPLLLRGLAAGYLAGGADGINFFNFFCPREGENPREPLFDTLKELKSLEDLRGKPKSYLIKTGQGVAETDGPFQIPVTMACGQGRAFRILMAKEPADPAVKAFVEVTFVPSKAEARQEFWLHLNDLPVGAARSIQDVAPALLNPADSPGGIAPRVATFVAPVSAIREGWNRLAVRSEADKVTVVNLSVRIVCPRG